MIEVAKRIREGGGWLKRGWLESCWFIFFIWGLWTEKKVVAPPFLAASRRSQFFFHHRHLFIQPYILTLALVLSPWLMNDDLWPSTQVASLWLWFHAENSAISLQEFFRQDVAVYIDVRCVFAIHFDDAWRISFFVVFVTSSFHFLYDLRTTTLEKKRFSIGKKQIIQVLHLMVKMIMLGDF